MLVSQAPAQVEALHSAGLAVIGHERRRQSTGKSNQISSTNERTACHRMRSTAWCRKQESPVSESEYNKAMGLVEIGLVEIGLLDRGIEQKNVHDSVIVGGSTCIPKRNS